MKLVLQGIAKKPQERRGQTSNETVTEEQAVKAGRTVERAEKEYNLQHEVLKVEDLYRLKKEIRRRKRLLKEDSV